MNTLHTVDSWFPPYEEKQHHIYIFLTSLNLGGAEKIVSDQLWANHFQKNPHKVTLIVLYEKDREHSIPPDVNVVRLQDNIHNGNLLFKQIAYEKCPLVAHLINDKIANYLFDFGIKLHLVIHNDKRGWNNDPSIFSHPNIISLISVCDFVTKQLKETTDKPVITLRHNIHYYKYKFNQDHRIEFRNKLNLNDDDILIGMTGRIVLQKNYFLALDTIAYLSRKNPRYKLVILGGFIKPDTYLYFELLKRINELNIKNNVFLTGFQDNAPEWLNAFDIALNTSHFEGLSMATQEFMRNGMQVVLSNVSGQPEILDPLEQLHFFDLPSSLNTIESKSLYIDLTAEELDEENKINFLEYKKLVSEISTLIVDNIKERIIFDEEYHTYMDYAIYGSHNIWNSLNFIKDTDAFNKLKDKAAFITVNLNLGGAQRSLVNLACYLKSQGYDIPVIMTHQSNYTAFYEQLLRNKVDSFLCHKQNDIFSITTSLIQYIYKNNITTLIIWNLDAKIKLIISKLLLNIKIIDVSPGDYCLVEMNNNKTFQEAVYYNSDNYFSNIHKFVSKFDNSHLQQEYVKILKSDINVIPNGVPVNEQHIKHNFRNSSDPFRFIVVGRIAETKYIHSILSSYKEIIKKHPDCSIDFYGNIEDYSRDYFEKLQHEYYDLFDNQNINFKGSIDEPMTIMKDYDAIIVLGVHQGSPNTVLEAAACRLPVIANDSGGTREVINSNTGILLDDNFKPDSLTEAMLNIIENYSLAVTRANNALDLIKSDFSMEKMANSYLNIIKD